MTTREKNLILYFLEATKLDKKNFMLEEKIIKTLSKLIDLLPKEHRKEGIRLESDLLEHLMNIKFDYLGYGANAQTILEESNLEWTPSIAEEIRKEVRKEEVA